MSKLNDNSDAQRRPIFKRKRGGEILNRSTVREIKKGRRELRREMKRMGIRSRKDFETTASSVGLYFDRGRLPLWWLFGKGGLLALLGAAAAALMAMFLFSMVTQLKGNFTINLTEDMLKMGFVLSETEDFSNPSVHLYSDDVENALPLSIQDVPTDVWDIDGNASGTDYFAYTFYCCNEGEIEASYVYTLSVTSESQNLSTAAWVMLYDESGARVFAEANADGTPAAIPALDDNTRGYTSLNVAGRLAFPDEQVQTIPSSSQFYSYYRIVPYDFESDDVVVSGVVENLQPGEYKKYTVVIWLEGDDPDCTDELIGGHMGLQMNFELLEAEDNGEEEGGAVRGSLWRTVSNAVSDIFSALKFM